MYRNRLRNRGREQAFWGALVGGLVNTIGGIVGAKQQNDAIKKQMRQQEQLTKDQALLASDQNIANTMNNYYYAQREDDNNYEDRLVYKQGGKVKGRDKLVITDGGRAKRLGGKTFLLRGGYHTDINPTGNTGIGINFNGNEIEAENNEVAQITKSGDLRIFSNQPMFKDGSSPAQKVIAGVNKNDTWKAQEQFKRRNGIQRNTIGRSRAKWGIKIGNEDYLNLGADILSSLGTGFFTNKYLKDLNYKYTIPEFAEETPVSFNTRYDNSAELAALERDRELAKGNIANNTASSAVALNRMNDIATTTMTERNKSYENKYNKELELRSKQAELESQMRGRNATNKNQYFQNIAAIKNAEIDANAELEKLKEESGVVNLQGLGTAVNNFISQGQQRYDDNQARIAYLAASNAGTPARMLSMGYDMDKDMIKKLYDYEWNQYDLNPNDKNIRSRLGLYGNRLYKGFDFNKELERRKNKNNV